MEQPASRTPFQQAGLAIERLDEFEQLRSTLNRVFASGAEEGFLRLLQRKGVPIRDFDRVRREKLLEQADPKLAQSGKTALQLYDALTVSDQAQMREFYLTMLEKLDLSLREKFNQLYRYY
jgi:CHAD domain-containing protein